VEVVECCALSCCCCCMSVRGWKWWSVVHLFAVVVAGVCEGGSGRVLCTYLLLLLHECARVEVVEYCLLSCCCCCRSVRGWKW
jgi:hypothetical protein